MRQLDSCDFCGDAPEGVFEVVPASVAGEARRLALCGDCRATLQSVTDPLLDAASESSGEQSGTEAETPTTRAEATTPSGDAFAPDTAASTVDDESASASTANDGVTIDAGDARGDDASANDAASSDGADDAASSDGADDAGNSDSTNDAASSDDTDDAADAPTADASTGRKPEGYAKVVRLLQNREGAMPRDDLRALATNAYDLSASAFEDAVDAAVENGDLEETNAGLRTA